MRRDQLEHVLRAACTVAAEEAALVIGSQAILGSFPERDLPDAAVRSVEVDITFLDDPNDTKSDLVDGALGELSRFHETFGYYAQGVSVTTAVLPEGWRERLVLFRTRRTSPGQGRCLEPHDLVISKLVAHREKDQEFAAELLRAGLLDTETLHDRIELTPVGHDLKRMLHDWIASVVVS
jgi:hypothetical protein